MRRQVYLLVDVLLGVREKVVRVVCALATLAPIPHTRDFIAAPDVAFAAALRAFAQVKTMHLPPPLRAYATYAVGAFVAAAVSASEHELTLSVFLSRLTSLSLRTEQPQQQSPKRSTFLRVLGDYLQTRHCTLSHCSRVLGIEQTTVMADLEIKEM